ncbi:acetyl-CoA sensor PanZ family protein [Pseudomonas aeruginosa]|uniref:acetyl-CoA sensor PanZ family protein n=1 Tax=Pseudomonas aeruginosa TaxID=287 RepID=UPI000A99FB0E|nr:acetyl-CoA sensor PanZ family protein [Pseudomonas aeruginosa]
MPPCCGAALVAAGLAAGELIAGRFNDRLLGAALLALKGVGPTVLQRAASDA